MMCVERVSGGGVQARLISTVYMYIGGGCRDGRGGGDGRWGRAQRC